MAEQKAPPRRLLYTIASITGVVISVTGAGGLVAIIATGNADPDPATAVGPGWSALAATLTIIGFSTAVVSKLGWILVDTREEVREVRGLLASTSLSIPRQKAQAQAQQQSGPAQQQKRPPRRGRRRAKGGQDEKPKEGDSGTWTPADARWQDDMAEAVRLGRTLPGPAEPA
ncbi:hypothetical protein ACFQZ4_24280 [Catellatospora coxensis]|uniref:Uncharacterized protein n=1 Tax=Catellatospora coxensis TaxID=310354 RepID=A0A8J3PBB0_9ACTN|nr:hypothetical protein [Catellatospora coxensis]GIG10233.1 hypothetical protein Cco03nite_69330 [Catellatospora coxensis]